MGRGVDVEANRDSRGKGAFCPPPGLPSPLCSAGDWEEVPELCPLLCAAFQHQTAGQVIGPIQQNYK